MLGSISFHFFPQSVPAGWARLDFLLLVGEQGLGRVMPGLGGAQHPPYFASLSHCGLPQGWHRQCHPEHESGQVRWHSARCPAPGAGTSRIAKLFRATRF